MRGSIRLWLLLCLCCALAGWAQAPAPRGPLPPVPAPTVTSTQAHQTLAKVLARREYQAFQKGHWAKPQLKESGFIKALKDFFRKLGRAIMQVLRPIGRWFLNVFKGVFRFLGRVFSDVGRWLARFFSGFHLNTNAQRPSWMGKGLRFAIIIAICVVAFFILGFFVSLLMTWLRRRHVPSARRGVLALDEEPEAGSISRKQEPTYWERSSRQAEELWARGEEREAMRILYRACLVLLDARGVLRYDDSRANGEVLRELRTQGKREVHDTLRPIVRSFDRSWYGFLKVSNEEFTQALEHSRRFRSNVVGEAS